MIELSEKVKNNKKSSRYLGGDLKVYSFINDNYIWQIDSNIIRMITVIMNN